MKKLIQWGGYLLFAILLLSSIGVGMRSAHAQAFTPSATCKEMRQVAVVVASGEKFQRICVPAASEQALLKVRAICNYVDTVVIFQDETKQQRIPIAPEQCQVFNLDDGQLYT
jgi:hypothetical protein